MLELRPVCEHCGISLPHDSADAMICTFECTFCRNCVFYVLHNVCPNCGGGFEKRAIRPRAKLLKHPAKQEKFIQRIDSEQFKTLLQTYVHIEPHLR